MPLIKRSASVFTLALLASTAHAADWRPVPDRMVTEYGQQVTVANAWQEYPRPHMQRDAWQNLNGLWEYAVTPRDATAPPKEWAGKILVPYCLESTLGGVGRLLEPNEALWYRRQFEVKDAGAGKEVLLNFEAVDYEATVFVNGREVGHHVGGNTPFSVRITDALKPGANELTLRVLDATQDYQLRGKQKLEPEGIWYTRVSGIWQTVWLEVVPQRYISELDIVTKADPPSIAVTPRIEGGQPGDQVKVEVTLGGGEPAPLAIGPAGSRIGMTMLAAKLWSPDSPTLYELTVTLVDADGKTVDSVKSYAGIREIGRRQDAEGHWRLTLNGKFLFHFGPLDQGWWPDGLLTPPSDAALVDEITFLKSAGFNMIRKHIKVEPRRYYYHCDRLGMLLWQDQPSTMGGPKWTRMQPNPQDAEFPDAAHQQYMAELEEMVDLLEVHPSIVVWVPFNEAWGQHRTVEVGEWLVKRDPTRLVNVASGGNFWPAGQIADQHAYPSPAFPLDDARFKDYVKVVGEFGGHGWPVKGHLWNESKRNWGYGGLPKTREEYEQRYEKTVGELVALKKQGIAAGVYTQTSDVEGEVNGLVTYDRREKKLSPERLKELHGPLYEGDGE